MVILAQLVLLILLLNGFTVSFYHTVFSTIAAFQSVVKTRTDPYQYVHDAFRKNNYTTLDQWTSKDPLFQPISYQIGNHIMWNGESVCRTDSFILLMFNMMKQDLPRRNLIRGYIKQDMIVDGKRINYVFLVVSPSNDTQQIMALKNENAKYGDILISLHEDNWQLLPLTILDAFYWVREYCKTVSFVAKMDGDSWVHLGNLVHYYKSLTAHRVFSGLMQWIGFNKTVWYKGVLCAPHDYPHPIKHVAGGGYVVSRDVVPFINIGASYLSVLFPAMEDVIITEILLKAGIELYPYPSDYLLFTNTWGTSVFPNNTIFVHNIKSIELYRTICSHYTTV